MGERLGPHDRIEELGGQGGREREVGPDDGGGKQRQDHDPAAGSVGSTEMGDPECRDRDRHQIQQEGPGEKRRGRNGPGKDGREGVGDEHREPEEDREEERRPLPARARVTHPRHADHEDDHPGDEEPRMGEHPPHVGDQQDGPAGDLVVRREVDPEAGDDDEAEEARSDRPAVGDVRGEERGDRQGGEQRAEGVGEGERHQDGYGGDQPRGPAGQEGPVERDGEQRQEEQAERLLVGDAGPPEVEPLDGEADPHDQHGRPDPPGGPAEPPGEPADDGRGREARRRADDRDQGLGEHQRADGEDQSGDAEQAHRAEVVRPEAVERVLPGRDGVPRLRRVEDAVEGRGERAPVEGDRPRGDGDREHREDDEEGGDPPLPRGRRAVLSHADHPQRSIAAPVPPRGGGRTAGPGAARRRPG